MNFFENILGAPQDFAGNSRSERKEQASCLRSQDFYRRAAGAPFLKLCASVPLREIILKVFSTQFLVFKDFTRIGMRGSQDLERIKNSLLCVSVPLREVFKKPQIKICDNLRNLRINLFSLVPNEQTEFAS